MMDRFFLWICLLFVAIPLVLAEDMKRETQSKEHENDSVWNQGKSRRLFARRQTFLGHGHQVAKLKLEPAPPVRRCARVTENCSPHTACCDPCSSCRCRLFNTICHCWRLSPHCPKKS
ncbi:agouti-signaling protein 2b [Osmerus eperlanus]|uniref:agouti-signaling protein 2b n=1 Tax=Osmerus eperlanus TaxID=29151 RepID=UPI002E0F443C